MRLSRKISSAVSILVLGASTGFMDAQKPDGKPAVSLDIPDFTAVQLMGRGRRPLPMKVYVSGPNVRVEVSPVLATLSLQESLKVYRLTVYPDKTLGCIVMRPDQALGPQSPLQLLQGTVVQRTQLGSEEVNGHKCTVESVEVKTMDGKTVKSKMWRAEDLKGAPVKIESEMERGKLLAVYGDVVLGTPAKTLFAVPDKCTPFEKMGQVVEEKTLE
jgi:hypothetical protein